MTAGIWRTREREASESSEGQGFRVGKVDDAGTCP